MAIAFNAATEAGTGSAATSLAINVPGGVSDGYGMLLFGVTADGDDGGFDALSGWTEIIDAATLLTGGSAPSPPGMSVWHRVASSEPASYTITPTFGSTGICAQMLTFSGTDETTLIDVTTTTATGNSTNADPAAIVPTTDGALTVVACFHDSTSITTHTVPSGYTDPDTLGRVVGNGGGNGCTMGAAYRSSVIDPATSENPAAFTTATEQWGAVTVALRPAVLATYEQEGFRWRDDDGSESGASWLANQDTDVSRADETTTRLRVLTDVTGDAPSEGATLQYRRDDEAATEWRDV